MAYAFNPFTGNLDYYASASGGGITIGTTTITGGTSTRILYDLAGVVQESANLTVGTSNVLTITEIVGGSGLTITGATQTTSKPLLNATQTWNAGAVAFTAAKINVTNTASATNSAILDLQIGGATVFAAGIYTDAGGNAFNAIVRSPNRFMGMLVDSTYLGGGTGQPNIYFAKSGVVKFQFGLDYNANGTNDFFIYDANAGTRPFYIGSTGAFTLNSNVIVAGVSSAVLQLGSDVNGAAVSQQLQACNGITGTDKTGGNLTLASGKGTGAGAVSSLIFQTPTVLGSGTTAQSLATRLTLVENSATLSTGTSLIGGANYQQWTEMTAPAAGAVNTVRLYAEDNGAGKTRLMALFNTGAAQQVAIEP